MFCFGSESVISETRIGQQAVIELSVICVVGHLSSVMYNM